MASWLIIILGLIGSWQYTDMESSSVFQSVFCPLMVGLFLIALLIKIVILLGPDNNGHGGDGGGFTGGFGGDEGSGGDGGC
jgi:hypothetical protein